MRELADYVEKHGSEFGRIEGVCEVNGSYRMLNLQSADVRDLVRSVTTSREAYLDPLSLPYG